MICLRGYKDQKKYHPFIIARHIQSTTYRLSLSKGNIKLLVSFQQAEVTALNEVPGLNSHWNATLLHVHISNRNLQVPQENSLRMQDWQEAHLTFKNI